MHNDVTTNQRESYERTHNGVAGIFRTHSQNFTSNFGHDRVRVLNHWTVPLIEHVQYKMQNILGAM